MKKFLIQQVRATAALARAWRIVYQNALSSASRSTRSEAHEFAQNSESNLAKIQRQLNVNAFRFPRARGIEAAKKGKGGTRPLVVAPINSRIVQRAIHDVLLNLPEIKKFAETPFSFGAVRRRDGHAEVAVPGAIKAVLAAIQEGATYAIRSDITSFFTKISKPTVTAIVTQATQEPKFDKLFMDAIAVELDNMQQLRERASQFPIYEVGVAQGCSLSPLLGNILLHDFDVQMNAQGVRCIRYIDDFLILARGRAEAERQFRLAKGLLAKLGMNVSDGKTERSDLKRGFVFLGIELQNGAIRPSREARARLLFKVSEEFRESAAALRNYGGTHTIARVDSVLRTLYVVSGIVSGWGHHYSFCNEKNILCQLDIAVDEEIRKYLGAYAEVRRNSDRKGQRQMLGIPLLEEFAIHPFEWQWPSSVQKGIAEPLDARDSVSA